MGIQIEHVVSLLIICVTILFGSLIYSVYNHGIEELNCCEICKEKMTNRAKARCLIRNGYEP